MIPAEFTDDGRLIEPYEHGAGQSGCHEQDEKIGEDRCSSSHGSLPSVILAGTHQAKQPHKSSRQGKTESWRDLSLCIVFDEQRYYCC
jgi:hypothetical protein